MPRRRTRPAGKPSKRATAAKRRATERAGMREHRPYGNPGGIKEHKPYRSRRRKRR